MTNKIFKKYKTTNGFPILQLEELPEDEKEICENCGKEFTDDYPFKNKLNKRIYCKDCIDKLFKNRVIKKTLK